MAKPTGFMDYSRVNPPKRPKEERLRDYREIQQALGAEELNRQAARCMDCGIPYCHAYGCPVENLIPDFNEMVYRENWRQALELLHSTNNFPEVTGRVCPAPCETACTLGINQEPVAICQLELRIVERGWQEGWITPLPAGFKTGRRAAVVGSGPAGLAAAQQLARAGHDVVVFEKDDRIGGILRYGIPDFKLEKWVLDRRLEQLRAEGVVFETDVNAGTDLSIRYLTRSYDAVLLAGGARVPRDIPIPGRESTGIHFAMDFLTQQNQRALTALPEDAVPILATGKDVIIIGGGDTGADCLGTSLRQDAKSVTQLEILPKPPPTRDKTTPWPHWPHQLRSSTSHEEGGERRWSVLVQEFVAEAGVLSGVRGVDVDWKTDASGKHSFSEREGASFELPADLVLIAAGFTKEGNAAVLGQFGIEADDTGTAILDPNRMTNLEGVFVAGDLSMGASLVVRAIDDGRRAAAGMDCYLESLGNPIPQGQHKKR